VGSKGHYSAILTVSSSSSESDSVSDPELSSSLSSIGSSTWNYSHSHTRRGKQEGKCRRVRSGEGVVDAVLAWFFLKSSYIGYGERKSIAHLLERATPIPL